MLDPLPDIQYAPRHSFAYSPDIVPSNEGHGVSRDLLKAEGMEMFR